MLYRIGKYCVGLHNPNNGKKVVAWSPLVHYKMCEYNAGLSVTDHDVFDTCVGFLQ